MKPSEQLQAAKELLVTKGWTQGALARGSRDIEVRFASSSAKKYDMIGACVKTTTDVLVLRTLEETIYPTRLRHWNDAQGRTLAEVLAKFDEAIALAKTREAV